MVAGDSPLEEKMAELVRAFRAPLVLPIRLLSLVLALTSVLAGVLFARVGTDMFRLGAALGVGVAIGLVVYGNIRWQRTWRRPEHALHRALAASGKELAAQGQRAHRLWKELRRSSSLDGGSLQLAELHFKQVLASVPLGKVRQRASSLRRLLLLSFFAFAVLCFGLLLARPLSLVEGVDILLARNGAGPFRLAYVAELSIQAEMPAYLEKKEKSRLQSSQLALLPQGSRLEVRIVPIVPSRQLLLTDGVHEEKFVSDGKGGWVAHWVADDPSNLRVAARFGDVLLFDSHETHVSPQEDRAPAIFLRGAPNRLLLGELNSLPLHYSAVDDHGISQIDLVMSSGQRSFRKELVHLDSQKRGHTGAYTLTREHELLRRAFLPVHVWIEARDGNTATGPSWGKSKVITLVPEPLGKEMASRHISLRRYRKSIAQYLATDMGAAHLSRRDALSARRAAFQVLSQELHALEKSLEGHRQVPHRSLVFLRAQMEALEKKGEERTRSESVLLATDALIHGIARREAAQLSKDLGSAVEEIAVQAREIRFDPESIHLRGLLDLLEGALAGASQLQEIGVLGDDLGSVAVADLGRVGRSLRGHEYGHAEAAALHLAERLKRGTPSFGSKGGGVESGSPSGGSSQGEASEGSPSSDAPEEFQELSQKVDELAQEAAGELSELERMLRDAQRAAEDDFSPSPELEKTFDELRTALEQLPKNSQVPDGARAEAASARSQGEAMLDALQSGDLAESLERGADAISSLERAQRLIRQQGSWLRERDLLEARDAIKKSMKLAKESLLQVQKKSAQGMKKSLGERAQRQADLSKKAAELAERGSGSHAPLGQESVQSLKNAARLLKQAAAEMNAGRASAGARRAEEAQEQLERALPSRGSASEGTNSEAERKKAGKSRANVPKEDRHMARDFRKRVEAGLGRASGRLSRAVRRYAEELK